MNLELMAMRWLWLEKNCHYVLEQRSPRYMIGLPDVLGVTANRHLTEIEVKRSVSDFRADAKKHHRQNRDLYLKSQPKQFYYLVPRHLKEKVEHLVPEWAGLMINSESGFTCEVVKPAPVNKEARRLSIKECVKLPRCMTNHMMSAIEKNEVCLNRFKHRDDQSFIEFTPAKVGTYEI